VSEHEIHKDALRDRKLPCEVTFEVDEKVFRGTSMHFNEKGMLVLCKHPPSLNARGKIALRFPGFRHAIEMSGEVVWTNMYGPGDSFSPKGMAIKFINIEKDQERLLTGLAEQYETVSSIYSCYYT
jgi:hypothetical protein